MNVYDFDDTILWGDSTVKFFKYCMLRYPASWASLPATAVAGIRYKTGKITLTQFKSVMFGFIKGVPDLEKAVRRFWLRHQQDIKAWYLNRRQAEDVIVSASPEFLLRPICKKLGVTLIATRVDEQTGKIIGLNCKSEEKVPRFLERYPSAVVDEFYSDSLSDTPLARLAKKAWVIDGEELTPWPEEV